MSKNEFDLMIDDFFFRRIFKSIPMLIQDNIYSGKCRVETPARKKGIIKAAIMQPFLFSFTLMKSIIYLFTLLIYSCNSINHPLKPYRTKEECDTASFHLDNKLNDTTKIVFIEGEVFDTTASLLRGFIFDRVSNKPIIGAAISMDNHSNEFTDTTNEKGEFGIFKDNFIGMYQMLITCKNYHCLKISNIHISGGQLIWIKLSPL